MGEEGCFPGRQEEIARAGEEWAAWRKRPPGVGEMSPRLMVTQEYLICKG